MELFFITWGLTSLLTFIWSVGNAHAHNMESFPNIMYKGRYAYSPWPYISVSLLASLIPPACWCANMAAFGSPFKWVWPKKGVNYLKEA